MMINTGHKTKGIYDRAKWLQGNLQHSSTHVRKKILKINYMSPSPKIRKRTAV